MRQEMIQVGPETLLVWVPETKQEMNRGYRAREPVDGEGMLFDVRSFAPTPLWIPIAVGKDAAGLDVLWIEKNTVTAIAENQRGCLQGASDMVLEVPAGWVKKTGVALGLPFSMPDGIKLGM